MNDTKAFQKLSNWIGGEMVPPYSKQYFPHINPSRGTPDSEVPDSGPEDVAVAVQAAARAAPAWATTAPELRSQILRKIALGLEKNRALLAEAEAWDNGKPVDLCMNLDIPRSQQNFEFFADAITQFHGETYITANKALNYTTYSPLGVVACISPWNLPLYLLTWKIAPALAAGNCVVAKPSELTPRTAFLLAQITHEAGLPPGVLNIIHGTGARVGTALVTHPAVKAVSFTGSTFTGKTISEVTAGSFKKLSLEMGGKNANVIFADCDFEKAVATTVRSSFLNQGQICLCGSRIFVEKPIYEKFKTELVKRVKALRQGDPMVTGVDQGALVSEGHMQKVLSYLQLSKELGGKVLCGGERSYLPGDLSKGFFIPPTVIENLSPQSRPNQEEIFGPVATLNSFESEEELLKEVNSTRYGLSASVWTQNLNRAHRVAHKIESGIVWINTWMLRDLRTPFGGVKDSGVGREGGWDVLKFFSEVKNTCVSQEF